MTTRGTRLADIASPSWSPDSSRIAFEARSARQPLQVFQIARSGGAAEPLPALDASNPAWSPDGRKVAYEQFFGEGGFAITTTSAAGGAATRLLATEGPWRVDPNGWQPVP